MFAGLQQFVTQTLSSTVHYWDELPSNIANLLDYENEFEDEIDKIST